MNPSKRYENQHNFWEHAGAIGYGKAQFSDQVIENHIMLRHWQAAMETAKALGLNENSTILELGCGDGAFAENILSAHFNHIVALDKSEAAIQRAQSLSTSGKVSYFAEDLTTYEYKEHDHWDGVFMAGFLHHVKAYAPTIVARAAKVCPKAIVIEPNGDNLIRKACELLPSYKRAGEDSLKLQELIGIFSANQYVVKISRRITFIPSFLPLPLFAPFKKLERLIESNPLLDRLCSTYILGFERMPF